MHFVLSIIILSIRIALAAEEGLTPERKRACETPLLPAGLAEVIQKNYIGSLHERLAEFAPLWEDLRARHPGVEEAMAVVGDTRESFHVLTDARLDSYRAL